MKFWLDTDDSVLWGLNKSKGEWIPVHTALKNEYRVTGCDCGWRTPSVKPQDAEMDWFSHCSSKT